MAPNRREMARLMAEKKRKQALATIDVVAVKKRKVVPGEKDVINVEMTEAQPQQAQSVNSDSGTPRVKMGGDWTPSTTKSFWDVNFPFSAHNHTHNFLDGDCETLKKLSGLQAFKNVHMFGNKLVATACAEEDQIREVTRQYKSLLADNERLAKENEEFQKSSHYVETEKVALENAKVDLEKDRKLLVEREKEIDEGKKLVEAERDRLKDEVAGLKVNAEKDKEKMTKLKEEVEVANTEVAEQFVLGFEAALEQIRVVAPSVDLDAMGPFKEVVDGAIVDAAGDDEDV